LTGRRHRAGVTNSKYAQHVEWRRADTEQLDNDVVDDDEFASWISKALGAFRSMTRRESR